MLLRMINFYDGGNYENMSPHRHTGKVYLLQVPVNKLNNELINFRNIWLGDSNPELIERSWQKFEKFSEPEYSEIIKKPLEFLFKDEIPTDKISKIIEIDTNKAFSENNYINKIFGGLKN